MNISYNWLKTLIEFEMSPQDLAGRLTLMGNAVDEVVYLGQGLEEILAARALSVRPHPGADRLSLVTVDSGTGPPLEVVCGAPNVKQGGVYPLARVGVELPGGMKITKAKIRGLESCGMLCSERELGLSEEASGLLELPEGCAPGAPLPAVLGRDDYMLVLDITANRSDLWSHLGVARELQPFVGRRVKLPPSGPEQTGPPIASLTSVTLSDPHGCPRYMARVIQNVQVGPSPPWLVRRLESVGHRSINNIVDVTNYILHELGVPQHAFDLDRLVEKRIVVRKAAPGEKIWTLDGIERALTPEMTIIADGRKPVAVAGVMGDLETGVTEKTTRILLECAFFDPVTTRRTGRALGLSTEASKRFERGTDYNLLPYAVDRAARMMAELSGGVVARKAIDAYPRKIKAKAISFRTARVKRLLGVGFAAREIEKWLPGVDFRLEKQARGVYRVTVPSFRHDVSREVDLIEELARLAGYDKIPVPGRMDVAVEAAGRERYDQVSGLRAALAGLGFQEVQTTSFVSSQDVRTIFGPDSYDPLCLEFPLSGEEDALRPSLLLTLLACVRRNLNQRSRDLRLFEIGSVFTRKTGEQETGERKNLALVATGLRNPVHWLGPQNKFDFFALKGALESLALSLRIPALGFVRQDQVFLHPGLAAAVEQDGDRIGFLGQLGPALARALDLPDDIFVLELALDPLLDSIKPPAYRRANPFPGSRRDLALLVDRQVPCEALLGEIRDGSALVAEVTLFDLYEGDQVPGGKKSLAFSILFQSAERTLRDEEVDRQFKKILDRLVKKFSVRQR